MTSISRKYCWSLFNKGIGDFPLTLSFCTYYIQKMILGKWPTWRTIFSMYLFQFSTCFEQPRAHHQENQLRQYNIWYMSLCVGEHFVCRSEICHSVSVTVSCVGRKYVTLCRWPFRVQVGNFLSDLHTKRSPTQSDIQDDVLIQLILLMMSTSLLETCRELK